MGIAESVSPKNPDSGDTRQTSHQTITKNAKLFNKDYDYHNEELFQVYFYEPTTNNLKMVNPLYERIHVTQRLSTSDSSKQTSEIIEFPASTWSTFNFSPDYHYINCRNPTNSCSPQQPKKLTTFDTFKVRPHQPILNLNQELLFNSEEQGVDALTNCNYTCHERCLELVTLDCKGQTVDLQSVQEELVEVKNEEEEKATKTLSGTLKGPELNNLIQQYNEKERGSEMILQDDGETFQGFIRVHMNLRRPINVVSGTRPPSIYNIMYEENESTIKTLTSFYLPRGTVKTLHVNSVTTTQEVISALLKKFKVIDNPQKFSLYEKYWDGDGTSKVKMRRLGDQEIPLWIPLRWMKESITNRELVLQENDTGDIAWDAFSLPELKNFLRILDREEQEYLNQVQLKYKMLTEKLQDAMNYLVIHDRSSTELEQSAL